MLEVIITLLNAGVNALGIFTQSYGLVEQVQNESQTMPAFYKGNDEYHHIDYDEENGVCYFRVLNTDIEKLDEEESATLDGVLQKITYSMRCVGFVPKDVYDTDNAYIDDKIASNIRSVLTIYNNQTVKDALQADFVESNVTGWETDRNKVIAEEYNKTDIVVDFDKAFFYVDFDFIVQGDDECLTNFGCDDEPFTLDPFANINFTFSTSPFLTY